MLTSKKEFTFFDLAISNTNNLACRERSTTVPAWTSLHLESVNTYVSRVVMFTIRNALISKKTLLAKSTYRP
jgi:hypothetical protein